MSQSDKRNQAKRIECEHLVSALHSVMAKLSMIENLVREDSDFRKGKGWKVIPIYEDILRGIQEARWNVQKEWEQASAKIKVLYPDGRLHGFLILEERDGVRNARIFQPKQRTLPGVDEDE